MTSVSSDVMRCAELALAEELVAEDALAAAAGRTWSDAEAHVLAPVVPGDVTLATICSSASGTESSGASSPSCDRKSEAEAGPRCGWCAWRPDCLQRVYNYRFALLLMCCFAFLQGVVVNGLTPLNTGSLERRFGLTSVETGWLNSAYDLAAATATVFLSYLADRRHKPRWLMFSAMCFTLGSLIFALPHFIASPYNGDESRAPLCPAPASLAGNRQCDAAARASSPEAYWQQVLLVGQVIMGIGGAVIYTVGISFIDDFSEPLSSGLHVGVTFLSTAVGAAAGYGVGSALLTLGVNLNRPDWPQVRRRADPNYVGAWWLGYVACSGFFALVALAFSCFDYEMPETAQLRLKRISETHEAKVGGVKVNAESRCLAAVVDFVNSLLKLVTNPVLICVTLALVAHALFSQGTQPFFVKIIENQFHVSESKAGFVVGAIIIVGISSAAVSSGYIMKRFEMTVRGTLMMITSFVFLSLVFSLCLLLHCGAQSIVGINVDYAWFGQAGRMPGASRQHILAATCNAGCNCSDIVYRPVCHQDTQVQFFSACHAGCQTIQRPKPDDPIPVYTNCSCLEERTDLVDTGQSLRPGTCGRTCPQFYPAMILMFLLLFCGFFTTVPLTGVVMRCVQEEYRSMALAFNQSVERFLGNIPGPLLIGKIIDFTCIFRREYCDSSVQGACFTYDSAALAIRLTALCVGLNSFAFLLYLMAFLIYKPPSGQTLSEYFRELRQRRCRKCLGASTPETTVTTAATGSNGPNANSGDKGDNNESHINAAFSSSSLNGVELSYASPASSEATNHNNS